MQNIGLKNKTLAEEKSVFISGISILVQDFKSFGLSDRPLDQKEMCGEPERDS